MSDVLPSSLTAEDAEDRSLVTPSREDAAAQTLDAQAAGLNARTLEQLNRPLRIAGQDWTFSRIREARQLPAPTDHDTILQRSRFFNDASIAPFEDYDAPDEARNVAANRIEFRRWAAERGITGAQMRSAGAQILNTYTDELYPPQRFRDGRVRRDPRAAQIARELVGENRSPYWQYNDAVPDENAYRRVFARTMRDDPDLQAAHAETQRAIRNSTANPSAPSTSSGPGLRAIPDAAISAVASIPQGLVSLAGAGAQGLEALDVPGMGTLRNVLEGTSRAIDSARDALQSQGTLDNRKRLQEALSGTNGDAVMEALRLFANGDRTGAAAAIDRAGLGAVWTALTPATILDLAATTLGSAVVPGAAGAAVARAAITGAGRAATVGRGAVTLGTTGAAEAAQQAGQLRQELIEAGVSQEEASRLATLYSQAGGVATVANALSSVLPATVLSRLAPKYFPNVGGDALVGTGGRLTGAVRGAAAGALTEAPAEAISTDAFNAPRQEGGLKPESVLGAAISGAVAGGAVGAAAGATRPRSDTPPAGPTDPLAAPTNDAPPPAPPSILDRFVAARDAAREEWRNVSATPGAERDAVAARLTTINTAEDARVALERAEAAVVAARTKADAEPTTSNIDALTAAENARDTARTAFETAADAAGVATRDVPAPPASGPETPSLEAPPATPLLPPPSRDPLSATPDETIPLGDADPVRDAQRALEVAEAEQARARAAVDADPTPENIAAYRTANAATEAARSQVQANPPPAPPPAPEPPQFGPAFELGLTPPPDVLSAEPPLFVLTPPTQEAPLPQGELNFGDVDLFGRPVENPIEDGQLPFDRDDPRQTSFNEYVLAGERDAPPSARDLSGRVIVNRINAERRAENRRLRDNAARIWSGVYDSVQMALDKVADTEAIIEAAVQTYNEQQAERDRQSPPSRSNPFDVTLNSDGREPRDVLQARGEAALRPGATASARDVLSNTVARIAPPGEITLDTTRQRKALDRELEASLKVRRNFVIAQLAARGQETLAKRQAAMARVQAAWEKIQGTAAKDRTPTIYQRRGTALPTAPTSVAQVAAAIRANTNLKNLPVPISVVASFDAASPEVQTAFAGDPTTKGAFVHFPGRPAQVIINAAAHADAADVQRTINHEVLGHYGFTLLNGSDMYNQLLNRIAVEAQRPLGDATLRAAWREAQALNPGADGTTLAAEVLARIAEDPGERPGGLITRILDLLRKLLGKIGIRTNSETDLKFDELQQLMVTLRDFGAGSQPFEAFEQAMRGALAAGEAQVTDRPVGGINNNWQENLNTLIFDTRGPLFRVAQAAHAMGITTDLAASVRTVANNVGRETTRVRDLFMSPVYDAIKDKARELGISQNAMIAALDTYAARLHASERNERLWLMISPLQDADAAKARTKLINESVNAGQSWAELRGPLRALVEAGSPSVAEADYAGAGITTAEAQAKMAALAGTPLMQAAKEVYPLLRAATNESTRLQVQTGMRDGRVVRLFGYENYVPLAGGKADPDDIFTNKVEGAGWEGMDVLGLKPDAGGRGAKQGEALNVTNAVNYDINGAAANYARQKMFTDFARVAEEARKKENGTRFADVVVTGNLEFRNDGSFAPQPAEGQGKLRPPSEYTNVFSFRDTDGVIKYLAIVDKNVADVLNEMIAPAERNKLQRATAGMGSLYTRFNPEYWLRGTLRDYLNDVVTLAMGNGGIPPGQARWDAIIAYNKAFGKALFTSAPWRLAGFNTNAQDRAVLLRDDKFENLPYFREFMDSGAVGRFTDQFRTTRDALKSNPRLDTGRLAETAQASGELVARYFGLIPETMEVTHRYAFYSALRQAGQSVEQAAARTVELTDFHQKSRASNALSNLYPFANVTAAGFSRWMTQEVYRDGAAPRAFSKQPNGTLRLILSPQAIVRSLAVAPTAAALLIGFMSVQGEDDLLGKDENGRSFLSMVSARTLGTNFLVTNPVDEKAPIRIPVPQTAMGYLTSIGRLSAAHMLGYLDAGQYREAAFGSAMQLIAPPGPSRIQFGDQPGLAARGQDVLASFVPEVLAPAFNAAFNRSGTGLRLDRTGQIASVDGTSFPLEGRAAGTVTVGELWNDVAENIETFSNGTISISPNRIREFVRGYGGYLARLGDRVVTSDARARLSANPDEAGGFVNSVLLPLFGADQSVRSYAVRESAAAIEPFNRDLQTYNILTERDKLDPNAVRTGRTRERGPLATAFLDANPATEDFLARRSQRNREDRAAVNGGQSLWNRLQQAVARDDTAEAVRLRAELDARAAEDASYNRKLWLAQTLLNAGTVNSWGAARVQAGLPAVSEDRPLRGRIAR